MTVRRLIATAGVLLVTGGMLSACSGSSGHHTDAGSCTWPKGDVSGYALALGQEKPTMKNGHLGSQHDHVLAFDVRTGRAVGDCTVGPGQAVQPPELPDQQRYPFGPNSYSVNGLPVPAVEPRFVPDNVYRGKTMHGGVRTLSDGTQTALPFTGWRVVATTSHTALVLTRDSGPSNPYRTSPADWCVLPSAGAARSRCTPVPGARSPGTAGIAPDGTVHWTPLAGRTQSVGGASVTVARGSDGTVTAAGVSSGGHATQLPTGLEQHSIVFLPGVPGPAPTTALRWVSLPAAASSPATVHVAAVGSDAVYAALGTNPIPTVTDGGAHLILANAQGQAVEYTPGQAGRRLPPLRLPSDVANAYPLSRPMSAASTTGGAGT